MSMIFCRSCGKQIHHSAPACPHCGAPNPTGITSEGATGIEPLPPGVAGWSWGAFLWNWVWAIGNKTWIGLLCLVPFIGFVMAFVLGFKGREWAWKNKEWRDLEHFNRVQRLWSVWGVIILLGIGGLGILAAIALPAYQDYVGRAVVAEAQGKLVGCQAVEQQAFVETGRFTNDNLYKTCITNLSTKMLGYGKATGPRAIEITLFLNLPSLEQASISVFGEVGAENQIKWFCVSPNIPQKYLGKNCALNDSWQLNTELLSPTDAEKMATDAQNAEKQAQENAVKLATGIPQLLRGRWANIASSCMNTEYPEGITTVDMKGLSGLEWGCELTEVLSTDTSSFNGKFNCSAEGQNTGDAFFELILLPDGRLTVVTNNQRDTLVRCGS